MLFIILKQYVFIMKLHACLLQQQNKTTAGDATVNLKSPVVCVCIFCVLVGSCSCQLF